MKKINEEVNVVKTVKNTYETQFPNITVIETIVNDGEPSFTINGVGPHGAGVVFVKPEFWDFIKTRNPWQEYFENGESKWGWDGLCFEEKNLSLDLIKDLLEGKHFIYCYGNGHEIFDADENIVPYAKRFDYIDTCFSNEKSKLKELVKHLSKHDWVINKDELEIDDIPYYNARDEKSKFVTVHILPSKEAYNELYQLVKEEEYWSTKMTDYVRSYAIKERGFDPMGLLPFLKEEK